MKNPRPPTRPGKLAVASAALLCCCLMTSPARAEAPADSFADMINRVALVPKGTHDSEMLAKATAAIEFIRKKDLKGANTAVNEALQLDARNSYLHFLNGFVYHLQAKQGDTQKVEVAIEGYQQALRLDPGNWIAQEFLGLAHMDLKQFNQARQQFSEVLLMTPESMVSMNGLMVSSYLTGDAVTACTMAEQLEKKFAAGVQADPEFVRSSIAVYAACGNFDQADRMLAVLGGLGSRDLQRADRRLGQWKAFHQRKAQQAGAVFVKTGLGSGASAAMPSLQVAQAMSLPDLGIPRASSRASSESEPQAASTEPATGSESTARAGGASPRMLLIDAVLLSTQELVSTSKGVNLLSALTLQLGSVSNNIAAYSRVVNSNFNNSPTAGVSTAITRAVTIPALSYSLNIANANNSVNEVLARPTLAAIEGLPSEFFSGTNLSAGVVSTSTQGGTTIVPLDKRFGIKLAVTPVFLPQGQVQLKVEAQRTSLNPGADNPRVAYQIEIAEIIANANVVMNLGDTLVLSGLSEKSSISTRDGVPGLQDVPGVQYLFSNKRTNDIQRSVLILVTPRVPAQVAEAGQKPARSVADEMRALRERFGLPESLPSNVEAIMNQLKPEELFREFRQGDVSMERWDRMRTTGDRLKEALEFLYY
jgi:pilus assembly protein CpaC